LTVPVFIAPLPSPVTVALICSLLGWPMTAAPIPAGACRRCACWGVLINHGNSGSRHRAGSRQ
jgi:hypothetical protein